VAYRVLQGRGFVLGIAVRAVVASALVYLALRLVLDSHLFATALVLAGVAALLIGDLVRSIRRVDVNVPWSVERQPGSSRRPSDLGQAPTAVPMLNEWRDVDYRQTLLDTVAAALFVVDEDGRAAPANRAARRLAVKDIHRLQDVEAIGRDGASRLLELAAGTRQILTLAEGRQMFVSVSRFSAPGSPPQWLISLQRISGELDAVEVKAWQDMFQVLAHEMMNSLTPIASLSESLEGLLLGHDPQGLCNPLDDEFSGALEAIRRRSRGLMEFVGRYRQMAQLPTPNLQEVRLADFLSGIERLMAGTFREARIEYRTELIPSDLTCRADARLLEQAVINLLRNAVDALAPSRTSDRQAHLAPRVDTTCRLQDDRVVLNIADNGAGLTPGSEDQIFVPFFSTKPDGRGIGLSVARQIILAHGGRLEARANAPRGSVFTVILPAASAAARGW
jgi:nitrogen fixation/metabolism regulation signal transduction histidine kinase